MASSLWSEGKPYLPNAVLVDFQNTIKGRTSKTTGMAVHVLGSSAKDK